MDDEKLKNAEDKIKRILINWFTSDAILLNLYSMFDLKPDINQDTFGVNILGKHPTITYNPNFVNKMPLEYLEMIMVHTGFKILLRHCSTRLKEPRQIAALASNIAVDELIYQNSMNILLQDPSLACLVPTAKMFKLPDKDCFEEYFRQLYERQNEVNEMIKKIWDSLPKEYKDKLIEDLINKQKEKDKKEKEKKNKKDEEESKQKDNKQELTKQENKEQKNNDDKQDKLEKQNEPETKENSDLENELENESKESNDGFNLDDKNFNNSDNHRTKYKEYKNVKSCINDYFDPNGNANDGWGVNDMFDADIKNFIDKNKDKVAMWGDHTGNFISEILAANEPKISYKEIIQKFKKSVDSYAKVNSRLKVNRRYDLVFPGHRRFLKTRIVFAIDVSGSMSDDDIAEGFAVLNKIIKHAEVIYILFDTKIKMIETNLKKAKQTFKVTGRGGTDFQEVLDYADKILCDGIVIFTDGFASPPKQPKAKVLWLTHTRGYEPPVSWGFRAHLNRFEDTHTW